MSPVARFWDGSAWQDVGGGFAQPLDTWHLVGGAGEPAFQNGWVNNDNSAAVPGTAAQRNLRFRKYPDGRVRLHGVIKSGTLGQAVFTLPSGYRPPTDQNTFVAVSAGGDGACNVTVNSSGNVFIFATGSPPSTPSTYAFLDGIEFDTETVTNWAPATLPGPVFNVYTTGPQAGTGGTVASAGTYLDSGVPARQLTIPSQPVASRARIDWKSRWDKVDAAWGYGGGGVVITPTVVKDYDSYAGSGSALIRDMFNGFQGAASYFMSSGSFLVDLAASQSYVVSHCFWSGQGSWKWDNSWSISVITAEVYAR